MSPRQYKKLAKRARDVLIKHHGFKANSFWIPPAREKAEHFIETGANVDGATQFGDIEIPKGTPVYLPEFTDYWGEANDPQCCIYKHREAVFWKYCGNTVARRMTKEQKDTICL